MSRSKRLKGEPRVRQPGMTGIRQAILLPLLFGAYPVLALLANNVGEARLTTGGRALIVSTGIAYLLWFFLGFWLKEWRRAGILSALILLLFFSYGHVYRFLEGISVSGMSLGRHRLLVPVWLFLAILVIWWSARGLRNLQAATTALHVIGIVAIIFPLYQLVSFEIRLSAAEKAGGEITENTYGLRYSKGSVPPDIYYIILDAYARDDILKEELGFDNHAFLEKLEEMGFVIARDSQSNYALTQLSLASALNFDYLHSLGNLEPSENANLIRLPPLIQRSKIRRILEDNGYTTIAFETGYAWSELADADVFLEMGKQGIAGLPVLGSLSDFEVLLIRTSGGLVLADATSTLPRALALELDRPNQRRRERTLFVLNKLASGQLTEKSPRFVFAHIVAPHSPYLFGPQGEPVAYPEKIERATYQRAYTDQVAFLNRRIVPILQGILERSNPPAIIILQADHGHDRASPDSRMKILNAYYLPQGGRDLVYPTISPVNTFRIVLNEYFGGDLPLLEDTAYFSTYEAPYDFRVIPGAADR